MRKIIFSALLFFVQLWSLTAAPVGEGQAISAALNFFQQSGNVAKSSLFPAVLHTEKSGGNVCYYVLKPAVGEGFLILSGDDEIFPVIGFSSESSFDGGTNPLFEAWMEQRKAEIERLLARPVAKTLGPVSEAKAAWNQLLAPQAKAYIPNNSVQVAVSPLLGDIKWGQTGYYNISCPYDAKKQAYTLTGCVATAMGQIMAYWGLKNGLTITGKGNIDYIDPSFGKLSTDFSGRTYKLSAMPAKLDATTPNTSVQEVARLLADCGKSVRMSYGIDASGAALDRISAGLYNYFGFKRSPYYDRSNYTASAWETKIKTEISASRPVAYGGVLASGEGHAWVVDGYGSYQAKSVFHFNWGWDGRQDGYYLLSLNEASTTEPDYMFQYNQLAVCGIEPGADSYLQLRNVEIEGLLNNSSIGKNAYTAQNGGQVKAKFDVYNPTSQTISGITLYSLLEFEYGYMIYLLEQRVSVSSKSSKSYSVTLNTNWTDKLGDLNFCVADGYSDGGNNAYFTFGRYGTLIACRDNNVSVEGETPADAVYVYGTEEGICIVNLGLFTDGGYVVYTVSGNKIAGGLLLPGTQMVNGMLPGIYVVEVISGNNRFAHKVVVK